MNDDVGEAKKRLPLPMLMHRLGLGEHARKTGFCPFHDDQRKSFSVYRDDKNEWRFKCFAGCGRGDEITLLELLNGISNKVATKLFLELAGVSGSTSPQPSVAAPAVEQRREVKPTEDPTATRKAFDWQSCVNEFNDTLSLTIQRRYSRGFCRWLKENGLMGKYNDCFAFPVHDRAGNVVAIHYRLKDGSWRYQPQGAKMRPLVIGELQPDRNSAFESYWDGLAYIDKSGERDGIIITRGASNGARVAELVPEISTLYLWTQNDEAGEEKWQRDICVNTKATVKRARIPAPHKDLNDWPRERLTRTCWTRCATPKSCEKPSDRWSNFAHRCN